MMGAGKAFNPYCLERLLMHETKRGARWRLRHYLEIALQPPPLVFLYANPNVQIGSREEMLYKENTSLAWPR